MLYDRTKGWRTIMWPCTTKGTGQADSEILNKLVWKNIKKMIGNIDFIKLYFQKYYFNSHEVFSFKIIPYLCQLLLSQPANSIINVGKSTFELVISVISSVAMRWSSFSLHWLTDQHSKCWILPHLVSDLNHILSIVSLHESNQLKWMRCHCEGKYIDMKFDLQNSTHYLTKSN